MPEIPNWIQPANEAEYALRGYGLGAQIGNEQAQSAMRAQELARQQQLDAVQQARWQAQYGLQKQEFELEAQQAAAKSKAILDYQNAIQTGTDPIKALMRYGPAMGQPLTAEAAAQRALMQKPAKTWQPVRLPQGVMGMMSSAGDLRFLPQKTAKDTSGALSAADKEELIELRHDREMLEKEEEKDAAAIAPLEALSADELKKRPGAQAKLDQVKKRKSKLAEIQTRIDEIRSASRKQPATGAQAGTSLAAQKVARAKEISAQNPYWSKEQVIQAVNQEFEANASGGGTTD